MFDVNAIGSQKSKKTNTVIVTKECKRSRTTLKNMVDDYRWRGKEAAKNDFQFAARYNRRLNEFCDEKGYCHGGGDPNTIVKNDEFERYRDLSQVRRHSYSGRSYIREIDMPGLQNPDPQTGYQPEKGFVKHVFDDLTEAIRFHPNPSSPLTVRIQYDQSEDAIKRYFDKNHDGPWNPWDDSKPALYGDLLPRVNRLSFPNWVDISRSQFFLKPACPNSKAYEIHTERTRAGELEITLPPGCPTNMLDQMKLLIKPKPKQKSYY